MLCYVQHLPRRLLWQDPGDPSHNLWACSTFKMQLSVSPVSRSAMNTCMILYWVGLIISMSAAQQTFEGQYADLLFGHIDQAYVAPRAQKVIQLLDANHAVLSGCDDGVTWWGNILANITNNGRTMYVDFSPKGGPSSVEANLTEAGHITWSGNNFWERTSYTASFQGAYASVFAGAVLPNFPVAYQFVDITVAPYIAPDYTNTLATIRSSAWGDAVVATGVIRYNTLTADFSPAGGPSGVVANLTQSGDIQWLEAENMWERSLCAAQSSGAGGEDDDDSVFTQNLALSIVSFSVMVVAVCGLGGFLAYLTYARRKNETLL